MIELLSPAGHWEAMAAAVQNGADAVYLGCGGLNARRGARNFTQDELPAAVQYCRLRGVKLYLTLNTLLTDRELPEAEGMLRLASRCGVDGVIVQDWGLAALARHVTPDLPLHGSTQMTVHSLAGVEEAARLGMRCVVLGRELSGEDIRRICEKSPIAIEVFAHGALCMCWSGQCAMSALIGGRSGNRGLCAQPCRLPYRMDGGRTGYPLSLKDACLASHLPELREMGVSILKLEGRMKRPEYVAVVTRIYAALLKENRRPTRDELRTLALAFSRDGFTDGYWRGEPGPDMFGIRREDAGDPAALFREAKAAYDREDLRTVPVSFTAEIRAGEPARLAARDAEGRTAAAEGAVPEPARTRPLTEDDLRLRLAKTGGTVFHPESIDIHLDSGLSLPASAVNALRRETLDSLSALRTAPPERQERPAPPPPEGESPCTPPQLTLSLSSGEQLTQALMALAPAVVYLPVERMAGFHLEPYLGQGTVFCAALPRICKDSELPELERLLEDALAKGCAAVSIQNLGQLALAKGRPVRGDFGLNVTNSRSLAQLQAWGLESATLSFELRFEQVRDLAKPIPCEAVVYGRLPLMVTENCLIANSAGCRPGHLQGPCRAAHTLTDRKGEVFPVQSLFGCRSEVENSKTLFLADKADYRRCGLAYARLRFTTERPAECVRVMERYLGKNEDMPAQYTRGLFYRGVE